MICHFWLTACSPNTVDCICEGNKVNEHFVRIAEAINIFIADGWNVGHTNKLTWFCLYVCVSRDNDDESIISPQASKSNESKVQLQQLINLLKKQDYVGVQSWLAKNIQSKKQV